MKKTLVVLAVLCGLVPAVQAVDFAGTDVGVTADMTYVSKYIWRGFSVYGSQSAWQPSLDFDLGGGFGANIWASYAGSSGYVDGTEYNYTLYYGGSVLDDCYKTDYTIGWRYYDFIDAPSKGYDLQEVFLEFSMPQLIGNGIVPRGAIYHMWQARSGSNADFETGQIYVMGLDYNFTLQEIPDLPMTFSWDIVYNDGVGNWMDPGDTTHLDHDWSHMLWGLKTHFACPMTGATVTPAVYFQNSFESSVNDRDHLFASVSYSLKF